MSWSVMLLLSIALVGMHQLVAAAEGSGHAHGAEVHSACHHESVGVQPDCQQMGDGCVAIVSDSWVDAEPPSGLPGVTRDCVVALAAAQGARDVDKPPDLTWLSVWRT